MYHLSCLTPWKKKIRTVNSSVFCRCWIVSQNCGRQPHIVSTNHSNLTAVGPNRSLASRQAIVWTYRPRVELTESHLPDFPLRWKTNLDTGGSFERFFPQKTLCPLTILYTYIIMRRFSDQRLWPSSFMSSVIKMREWKRENREVWRFSIWRTRGWTEKQY